MHTHGSSLGLFSLRRLHCPLLPHNLLSYHPVLPSARQLHLPGCGGQIPCALPPMRTSAPLPSTTLSQNLGTAMMSRWRFDMRTHLAVTCTVNQHEEDRMRDIHVGKRGSEAAGEDQPEKLRKTIRFEQEASTAAQSSDPAVHLEYPASG